MVCGAWLRLRLRLRRSVGGGVEGGLDARGSGEAMVQGKGPGGMPGTRGGEDARRTRAWDARVEEEKDGRGGAQGARVLQDGAKTAVRDGDSDSTETEPVEGRRRATPTEHGRCFDGKLEGRRGTEKLESKRLDGEGGC